MATNFSGRDSRKKKKKKKHEWPPFPLREREERLKGKKREKEDRFDDAGKEGRTAFINKRMLSTHPRHARCGKREREGSRT